MDLMFDNAIKFNPKEHIIHELVGGALVLLPWGWGGRGGRAGARAA
jgi:hypothetical protein